MTISKLLVNKMAMARVCEICGKKPWVGMQVSHAHNRTKRRWNPNLQKIRIQKEGRRKYAYVCTKCIKSGRVVKAV